MNYLTSKSHFKKIITITLPLLVVILAGFFLNSNFQSRPAKVTIENSSAIYQLSYKENPGFTAFLKQMSSEYPARKSIKANIDEINIVVNDQSAPGKPNVAPIIPITVLLIKDTFDLKQLKATIQIDPTNLQTFNDSELSESIFTSMVGQIYAITHPTKTIEERVNATNDLVKQLHATNSNPFVLVRK